MLAAAAELKSTITYKRNKNEIIISSQRRRLVQAHIYSQADGHDGEGHKYRLGGYHSHRSGGQHDCCSFPVRKQEWPRIKEIT